MPIAGVWLWTCEEKQHGGLDRVQFQTQEQAGRVADREIKHILSTNLRYDAALLLRAVTRLFLIHMQDLSD